MKKSNQKYLLILIGIILSIFLFVIFSAQLALDFFWLKSQGAFLTALKLFTFRWLTIPIFGIIMGIVYLLYTAISFPQEFSNKKLVLFKTFVIIVVSMICEYFLHMSQAFIYTFLGASTGKIDPLVQLDMSFYLFWVPLLKKSSVFFLIYFSVLLFFRIVSSSRDQSIRFDKTLLLTAGFFVFIFLVGLRLDVTINSLSGNYLGYFDIFGVLVPFILSALWTYLFFVISVLFLKFKSKVNATGIIITMVVLLAANIVWPIYLKHFIYSPNISSLQQIFAGIHAESTRKAFDIDELIRDDSFIATESNISQILKQNFWQDQAHFLESVRYNQEIMPNFVIQKSYPDLIKNQNSEFDPYFISLREIESNPQDHWDAKHFRNIFGYGAVIGSASSFNKEGYPDLLLKDLELNSSDPSITINNPQIFFSESYKNYVFINTTMSIAHFGKSKTPMEQQHFENVSGIPMNFFMRIILTIVYRDTRFLFTDYFTKDTKLILIRKPSEIAKRILPIFRYDEPRVIYHNQELWWEMDAYSMSDSVFSAKSVQTPWGMYNWLRSPMKVYVSAYSGEIVFKIMDPQDPHVRIARKIYPRLFRKTLDLDSEKFVYPTLLFDIQSRILEFYHDLSSSSFYSGINRREIAVPLGADKPENIKKIMLIDQKKLAYQRTYTHLGKNIFAARILGFINSEGQKKLYLFEAPANLGIPGLAQAEAFLNQDPKFSELATLWGQRGSRISTSDTIFYPLKKSGMYLRTIFIESESVSIPIAARFAVIDNTKITLGTNIQQLVDNGVLFIHNEKPSFSELENLKTLVRDLYQYYLDAENARINSNSQEYQENVDKIGKALQKANI